MKPLEQILYEQFAKEVSPNHYLPWDQLPDLVRIAWKNVLRTAQFGPQISNENKNDNRII